MGESSRAQEKYIYHTAGTQNLDSTYALQYSPKIPSSRGRIGDRIRPRLDGSEDWIASWSATIQRGLPSKRFSSPLWFFKWQKKKQSNTRRQRTEGGRAHSPWRLTQVGLPRPDAASGVRGGRDRKRMGTGVCDSASRTAKRDGDSAPARYVWSAGGRGCSVGFCWPRPDEGTLSRLPVGHTTRCMQPARWSRESCTLLWRCPNEAARPMIPWHAWSESKIISFFERKICLFWWTYLYIPLLFLGIDVSVLSMWESMQYNQCWQSMYTLAVSSKICRQ